MTTKTVYQLDADGYYVGETLADESPMEPGVFMIPDGCVEDAPPSPVDGKLRRYINRAWVYEDAPPSETPSGPTPTSVDPATEARAKRNALLLACDWTQLPDVSSLVRAAWLPYRQELRDVPQQATFPQLITWPVAP